jgi:hypothetical protein
MPAVFLMMTAYLGMCLEGKCMKREQYKDFDATQLFCPSCKQAVPVRKRLLLVLTTGEKYDYTCVYCGTSVGDKMVSSRDNLPLIIR